MEVGERAAGAQVLAHEPLEVVEEDLGDEVVVLAREAVDVLRRDAEHFVGDAQEAVAVHALVVLLRHEGGTHRLVAGLARHGGDDLRHPVVDDRLGTVDRPEHAPHRFLLARVERAEARGVGGEVDAVRVPRVDVRRGDDVVERLPAAGDLAVGGLVCLDQGIDLADEAADLRVPDGGVHGTRIL